MSVLFIIFAIFSIATLFIKFVPSIKTKRTLGISTSELEALSWPSRQIMTKYHTLPAANRPFPNIYNILRALDIKNKNENINTHFSENKYVHGVRKNVPTLDCCYGRHREGFWCNDYYTLTHSIIGIQKALTEQANALELAGVSGGLQDAALLAERMREEQDLIRNVTKELQ